MGTDKDCIPLLNLSILNRTVSIDSQSRAPSEVANAFVRGLGMPFRTQAGEISAKPQGCHIPTMGLEARGSWEGSKKLPLREHPCQVTAVSCKKHLLSLTYLSMFPNSLIRRRGERAKN